MATERLLVIAPEPLVTHLHLLVFGSTLVVYNLPRMLPRPYGEKRTRQELNRWYIFFFFAGMAILLPAIPALPPVVLLISLAMGILAFAYFLPSLPLRNKKRLRDFGLLKILVLTAVWTGATSVLPIMYLRLSANDYPYEILLRFIFVFALCILFDLRDMETDSNRNIKTIPNKIGVSRSYLLVHVSLLVFVLLSFFQYIKYPIAGRLAAACLTAIATLIVSWYVRKHPGHKSFVAMTDGMMLLYAVLILLQ